MLCYLYMKLNEKSNWDICYSLHDKWWQAILKYEYEEIWCLFTYILQQIWLQVVRKTPFSKLLSRQLSVNPSNGSQRLTSDTVIGYVPVADVPVSIFASENPWWSMFFLLPDISVLLKDEIETFGQCCTYWILRVGQISKTLVIILKMEYKTYKNFKTKSFQGQIDFKNYFLLSHFFFSKS